VTAAGFGLVERLARSHLRFGRAAWDALAGETRTAPSAWDRPTEAYGDLMRNYAVDLAQDWASTARALAQDLQPLAPEEPHAVAIVDDRAVALPARIAEASQGSAIYAVRVDAARTLLASLGLPFEPVVAATGDALLVLFMVDYRKSDLGAYFELGAAIMGRPAGDPLAPPGMVVFALPVSGAFTRDCGRRIWGYPKALAPDLTIRREGQSVECRLADAPDAFRMRLSRRAFGASHEVPLTTYTLLHGRPTRTVFNRSGRAERLRAGGKVELTLGGARARRCECALASAAGSTGCLCRQLRALGLPKPPIASGWTEILTGAFGAPEALDTPRVQSSPKNSA
jgi:hypothetical protein